MKKYAPVAYTIILIATLTISVHLETNSQLKEQIGKPTENSESLVMIEKNSLLPVFNPSISKYRVVRRIKAIITGYSSSAWETDNTPYITAAGIRVRDGVIANNFFDFGTKVRIPQLYGNKIFVVFDRMSWKKNNYHFDIWFPSYQQAKEFGVKRTYIEILEN